MNLVIDWGNTRIKAGWFEGNTLVETARYVSAEALGDALVKSPPRYVMASSTSRPADELRTLLNAFDGGANWLLLTPDLPIPIRNAYETPRTLGADRLAAAVGAVHLFPAQNCLILDLGTCITADFVSADGTFQGGLISPGLRMRLQAMHTFTARLPLLDNVPGTEAWPLLTARNTREAMLSGAMNGMTLELAGIIEEYTNCYEDLRVILCGGDGPLFINRLKPGIFAVPELVLQGLNRIMLTNLQP
ncbi:type III pantothenate kinase [Fibrella forsythiae]|uniref:Type III pantothenate kinase n=1 Tax=Fibrella forsythiae TaxID=2817061 RepID=A0ABS3JGJ1_9BACT|nr:type III pantothenate kinase [Fibrella forsythiae]MBO0949100.1 type III pantothenate kinase [Fibrella forsythiae]